MRYRLAFVLALSVVWGCFILALLFINTIVKHDAFVKAAESQHIAKRIVKGRRGQIFAYDSPDKKNFFALATNIDTYQVLLVPKNIRNIDRLSQKLSALIGLTEEEIKERFYKYKDAFYMPPLKKGLDYEVAKQIEEIGEVGVLIEPEERRFYPEKTLAAQVIGFVNFEGDGAYGIESAFDSYLKPSSGIEFGKKDILGSFVSVISSVKPRDGAQVYLTLDRNVQFMVEEKLREAIERYQADSGAIVVLEVPSGNVVAMAEWPTFDLNEFNKLKEEEQKLFLSSIVQRVWEPGSVLKPIVMAAALDSGAVPEDFQGTYGSKVIVQGYEISTATGQAYGKETLSQILENSDNVAMVDISSKLGIDKMYEYLAKFNFGEKLGFEITPEATGKLLPRKDWREITRATVSFGQGISVTPLQLASAYLAIANRGKLVRPKIVEKIKFSDGREEQLPPVEIRQVISEETAQKITKMLISVVERGHGKKAAVPGYKVAGKTGTAQIPKENGKGYEEGTHIGSFAGFFPADNPRFVIVVKLDKPKNVEFAESSAAPTFSEVARSLITYYKIPVSLKENE